MPARRKIVERASDVRKYGGLNHHLGAKLRDHGVIISASGSSQTACGCACKGASSSRSDPRKRARLFAGDTRYSAYACAGDIDPAEIPKLLSFEFEFLRKSK